jgi:hypothetical protein
MTLPCSPGGDPLRPLEPTADSDVPTAAVPLVEGPKATVSVPVRWRIFEGPSIGRSEAGVYRSQSLSDQAAIVSTIGRQDNADTSMG